MNGGFSLLTLVCWIHWSSGFWKTMRVWQRHVWFEWRKKWWEPCFVTTMSAKLGGWSLELDFLLMENRVKVDRRVLV